MLRPTSEAIIALRDEFTDAQLADAHGCVVIVELNGRSLPLLVTNQLLELVKQARGAKQ